MVQGLTLSQKSSAIEIHIGKVSMVFSEEGKKVTTNGVLKKQL